MTAPTPPATVDDPLHPARHSYAHPATTTAAAGNDHALDVDAGVDVH